MPAWCNVADCRNSPSDIIVSLHSQLMSNVIALRLFAQQMDPHARAMTRYAVVWLRKGMLFCLSCITDWDSAGCRRTSDSSTLWEIAPA